MSRSIITQHCEAPRRKRRAALVAEGKAGAVDIHKDVRPVGARPCSRSSACRCGPMKRRGSEPHPPARAGGPSGGPHMRNPLPKVTDTGRVGVFLSTLAASKLDPSPVLLYGLAVLGAMLILWEAVHLCPKTGPAHPVQVVPKAHRPFRAHHLSPSARGKTGRGDSPAEQDGPSGHELREPTDTP